MTRERSESRRRFLKPLAWTGAGLLAGGLAVDAAHEQHWLQVTRQCELTEGEQEAILHANADRLLAASGS